VLLVDDDRPLSHSIQRHLARLGCRVELAHDGDAAVAALARESFDVMLLDLSMQPRDGWFVLSALRDMIRTPRVIVLSGMVDVATAVRAMRHGAVDVLQKPFALDTLARQVLAGVPADPPAARSGGRPRPPSVYPEVADPADLLIGKTPEIAFVREKIRSLARYRDLPVLIVGETGTGKELAARAIHELSGSSAPMVALNCAAIPEQLFESELFGHESGAFTGARGPRRGLLEEAADGTLFLDEVGEMSSAVQAKLLRALETRRFRRIGASADAEFNARIVSATHRGLLGATEGTLRPDLYYRLAALTVQLPPLRARPDDIELLAAHFLSAFARRYGQPTKRMSGGALGALRSHPWPGNVRELRSVIDRVAVASSADIIDENAIVDAVPLLAGRRVEDAASAAGPLAVSPGLRDVERRLIIEAFVRSDRNLSDAARQLGIPRSTLRDKLRRFDVR
jgi:DNA-binding NtrC family response regulator